MICTKRFPMAGTFCYPQETSLPPLDERTLFSGAFAEDHTIVVARPYRGFHRDW